MSRESREYEVCKPGHIDRGRECAVGDVITLREDQAARLGDVVKPAKAKPAGDAAKKE